MRSYLPPEVGELLRGEFTKLGIHDREQRRAITELIELAHADGTRAAYARGYADGDADREAEHNAPPPMAVERLRVDMHRTVAVRDDEWPPIGGAVAAERPRDALDG